MHTQTYPTPNDMNPRAQLAEVSHRLLDLHEILLTAVKAAFEKLYGRVDSPATLLALVMNDPLFDWLRPMSALIVELDSLVDDKDATISLEKLDEVRTTIERWISVTEEPNDFAAGYRALLQADPGLVMAHAALKQELAEIPRARWLN